MFYYMAAILVVWQGHQTHFFKPDTLVMIVAKFG